VPLITVLQQEIVTLTAASGMARPCNCNSPRGQCEGYDGNLYTFAPGKALTIPVEAAKHIFEWDERNMMQ
jgi:hypothetical protein